MPFDPNDLFTYAKACVDNKSAWLRIKHSAKMHTVRSALSSKGSFGSKAGALVGVGVRLVLNQIPIPAVGSVAGAIERAIENKVRQVKHKGNLDKAKTAGNVEDEVKFTLKELSVEELDRFRWKVIDSIKELNTVIGGFQANYDAKSAKQARCEAYLDLAMAVMQAERRLDKLKTNVLALMAALQLTTKWIETCANGRSTPVAPTVPVGGAPADASVNGVKAKASRLIADAIKADVDWIEAEGNKVIPASDRDNAKLALRDMYHHKCERWCCFNHPQGVADKWASGKDKAAAVARFLTTPFLPDDFNNNLFQLWKVE